MADTDTRTFRRFTVIGPVEVRDSRTGLDVAPGGVVELTTDSQMLELFGGIRQELLGVNIDALIYSGLVAPVEDAPVKTPKA